MKNLFLVFLLLVASPALAVEPGEILDDPVLEARARDLSKGLRCLVCRNQNIDESNASLARDLRVLVRERLVAGDSDTQAVAFIVDRYGEFVLLKPTSGGANLILWIAGPAMLFFALGVGGYYASRRRKSGEPEALSNDEKSRLDDILRG